MRQIYIDITGGSLTILNEWKIVQDDGPGVIVSISGGDIEKESLKYVARLRCFDFLSDSTRTDIDNKTPGITQG